MNLFKLTIPQGKSAFVCVTTNCAFIYRRTNFYVLDSGQMVLLHVACRLTPHCCQYVYLAAAAMPLTKVTKQGETNLCTSSYFSIKRKKNIQRRRTKSKRTHLLCIDFWAFYFGLINTACSSLTIFFFPCFSLNFQHIILSPRANRSKEGRERMNGDDDGSDLSLKL